MFRTYDLSGIWDFSMAQMAKGTFPTAFDDTIALPGTTSLAKKGAPNPNREAGFLTDAYAFEGQAWFRKEICIDPELFDTDMGMLPIKLTLERTRMTPSGSTAGLWAAATVYARPTSMTSPIL